MSPIAARRRCTYAGGCSNDAAPGRARCAAHERQATRGYDLRRGSRQSRGYNNDWLRHAARFLDDYPYCGDRAPGAVVTTDSRCIQRGLCYVKATVADHIRPVTGADDPSFFEWTALQALCDPCHNAKRQREGCGK